MRAKNAASNITHGDDEAASAASKPVSAGLDVSCVRACELAKDFWSRGSPFIVDDRRSTEEAVLTELWRELRMSVVCVAGTPALSFEDVVLKQSVQQVLRTHELCGDLLDKVAASIVRDVQALIATQDRGSTASQPGWFGRNFILWKRAEDTPLLHA